MGGIELGCALLSDETNNSNTVISPFLFIKDDAGFPRRTEIGKQTLKRLFLAFKEFYRLLSWLPVRYF